MAGLSSKQKLIERLLHARQKEGRCYADMADAAVIASDVHFGQKDWNGRSRAYHWMQVAQTDQEHLQEWMVGILHDVVEDTAGRDPQFKWELQDFIALGFSDPVVEAIDSITRRPDELYLDYIQRCGMNSLARGPKIRDLGKNSNPAFDQAFLSDKRISKLNCSIVAWPYLHAVSDGIIKEGSSVMTFLQGWRPHILDRRDFLAQHTTDNIPYAPSFAKAAHDALQPTREGLIEIEDYYDFLEDLSEDPISLESHMDLIAESCQVNEDEQLLDTQRIAELDALIPARQYAVAVLNEETEPGSSLPQFIQKHRPHLYDPQLISTHSSADLQLQTETPFSPML